jgi:general secretion pathway protein G
MLIVLGILVALAALVVPRLLGMGKKADVKTTKAQIGSLKGALTNYALDNKGFPTTEQGLDALLVAPGESEEEGSSAASRWDGPYLQSDALPKDAWGNDFGYAYPPEKGKIDFPDIWSSGPDGEEGTEDDICSWSSASGEGGGDGELGGGPDENRDVDIDTDFGAGSGSTEEF